MRIPIYEPELTDADKKLMQAAIESGWISSLGPYIKEFEDRFSNYTGLPYCVSCSTGTSALHLALKSLNIGPGHRVGIPSFTYVATANAVKYVGAEPVFFDVSYASWNLNIDDLADEHLEQLDCIILVDIYGLPSLSELQFKRLKQLGILVVQDCAESLGAFIDGKHVGHFCDVATFSFFGNKTLTTGEGGMVATKNVKVRDRVNILKDQGRKLEPYFHYEIGYNYRMTNIQAALGVSQISRIVETLERKAALFQFYWKNFKNLGIQQQVNDNGSVSSHWMCAFLFPNEDQMKKTKKYLSENEIETRPFFTPIENFPMYGNKQAAPNCERLKRVGLCLPSYPTISKADQKFIKDAVIRSFM